MKSNVEKISDFLFEAHEAGDRFVNLEKDMKPKDFDEAYEVQKQLRQKLPRGSLGAVSYTHLTLPTKRIV